VLSPVARLPAEKIFEIFMCGTVINYLIPVRAGELAKSLILKKTDKIPTSRSLPTIFIDKLFDLTPVFLLLLLLPYLTHTLPREVIWILLGVLAIFILLLILLTGAALKRKMATDFLKWFFSWIPGAFRLRVHRFLELFLEGFTNMGKYKKVLPVLLLLTFIAVIFDACYLMAMFAGFGAYPPFLIVLFSYTLINLSYILPTPPAQIGSNEVIWVLIFTGAFGMNVNLISAVESFAHIITGGILFLVGAISSTILGMKFTSTFSLESDNRLEKTEFDN